jgi:DNA-binding PadR family transcriptional regulator
VSVRHGLLALLADGPSYGYQLRARLEERTGGTWPLNIGQIYTTLTRLQRDGLVEPVGDDGAGHATYQITPAGRASVADWFRSPVDRAAPARDELAIKLALAVGSPMADVREVVQVQRSATMRALQEYTRLKVAAGRADDLAWLLVLDALVFQAEAEVRWLDHCETRLARAAGPQRADTPVRTPAPPGRPALHGPPDGTVPREPAPEGATAPGGRGSAGTGGGEVRR